MGFAVDYVDEGLDLRGTGGALRFIADSGLLDPVSSCSTATPTCPSTSRPVWRTSEAGQVPTMTIIKNENRWDKSNVVFRDGELILYDKRAADPVALGMNYIDYGLSVLTREAIVEGIRPGAVMDLSQLLNRLSLERRLRAYEVFERFYEIGSPQGLDDFV